MTWEENGKGTDAKKKRWENTKSRMETKVGQWFGPFTQVWNPQALEKQTFGNAHKWHIQVILLTPAPTFLPLIFTSCHPSSFSNLKLFNTFLFSLGFLCQTIFFSPHQNSHLIKINVFFIMQAFSYKNKVFYNFLKLIFYIIYYQKLINCYDILNFHIIMIIFLSKKKIVSIWEEPQNDQVVWIDVFLFHKLIFYYIHLIRIRVDMGDGYKGFLYLSHLIYLFIYIFKFLKMLITL